MHKRQTKPKQDINSSEIKTQVSSDNMAVTWKSKTYKNGKATRFTKEELSAKSITLTQGAALIIGIMIGSGIFVAPKFVLEKSGSVGLMVVVWTLSGLIAMLGALCYCELGTLIQKSGGEYIYFKEAYGSLPAFLVSWTIILVLKPASIAIICMTFAYYSCLPFLPEKSTEPTVLIKVIAMLCIVLLTIINCLSTTLAAQTQVLFTGMKLIAIGLVVMMGLYNAGKGHTENFVNLFNGTSSSPGKLAHAFYSGLWAFDGWNQLNYVTGELKNPTENLPKAVMIALPLVTLCYVLVNIAYLSVLTPVEVISSSAVAVSFGEKVHPLFFVLMPLLLKTSIKTKNILYKKYIKTQSYYNQCKYKIYRNKLSNLIRLSKKQYYNDYFTTNSKNSKNMWHGIRQLVSLKTKVKYTPSKILKQDQEITDPKKISDEFNNYFANVGKNLASAISNSSNMPEFSQYLKDPIPSSIHLTPFTNQEIENIINGLNSSKATGPYSVPVDLLKSLSSYISYPLSIIFNYSLSSGIVPDHFKLAKVIPIYKKGSSLLLSNYRPISLLSIFNKILEKLIFNRLVNYLDKYSIIYDKQFGFRAKHSTVHAVTLLTNKIQEAIDSSKYSCGIFIDLCKAFDTVDHNILLNKLEHYGIRGIALKWFTSYLNNRKQYVSINQTESDHLNIEWGVPY